MYKRIPALILAIVLVLSLLPAVRAEGTVLASGEAGDGITWTLTADYHLSLTGSGAMDDYTVGKAPWNDYRNKIVSVSLTEGITSVGNSAFWYHQYLTSVTLPGSLVRIGENAFSKCTRLPELQLPDGCTTLGRQALNNCDAMVSLVLPQGLVTIGAGAFSYSDSLTEIQIFEGVTSIGKQAFYECPKLTSVSIPASVTEIGADAFDHCPAMTAITVAPANTVYSSDSQGALYDKAVTTLITTPDGCSGPFTIPETVTTLADNAFHCCNKLTGVTIPAGCLSWGDNTFAYCYALTEVSIPEGVTTIPTCAFYYCVDLTHVSIPETVTAVERSAFGYCESLEEITLPQHLDVMESSVFTNCSALRSIVVPEGVTELYATFHKCSKLETVVLPSTLKEITVWCFEDCYKLSQINLPEGLEELGANTFEDTFALKSIVFPSTLKTIHAWAFENSGLETITFLGSAPEFPEGMGSDTTYPFGGVTATVYYPGCDPTWTEEVRLNYDGNLTWVPMDGHTWLDATCTEPKKCAGCGVTEGEALGHAYGEWYVSQTPSCVNDGTERRDCPRCGGNETRNIPATGHSYTATVIAPTCTGQGYTLYTCSCGDSYTDTYTDLLDHSWDEGVVITEPTEQTPGVRRHTCTVCGATEDRPISQLEHTHRYEAVVTPPTCTEPGFTTHTCSCGDSYTDTPTAPLGHDWYGLECRRCNATRENPFTDTDPLGFYFDALLWAVENGITTGTTPTTFNPLGQCQRGQVVTFLWRAAGKPEPKSNVNPFVDVKEGSFYYKAVLWAVENGITNGLDATHFGPNAYCNRAQVVTFLWRTVDKPQAENPINPFTDVKESGFYYNAVLWAVEQGITKGLSADTFGVAAICNRAQIVTFLYRTFA